MWDLSVFLYQKYFTHSIRRQAAGWWMPGPEGVLGAGPGGLFGVAWGVPGHPRSAAARGMEFWRCGGEKKVRLPLGCIGCRIGASWLQEQPNSPLTPNSAGSAPALSPHIRGRWALQHFLCRISPHCLVGAGLWVPVAPGPPRGGRVVGFPSVLCSGHV